MLIPSTGCFNIIMVTDVPAYVLPNTIVPVFILIWGKNSAPWDEVVNILVACVAESTPRENMKNPIRKNISLNISREKDLILCSSNKPFSLHLKSATYEYDVCLHQLFGIEVGVGYVTVLTSRQYLPSLPFLWQFLSTSEHFPCSLSSHQIYFQDLHLFRVQTL